MHRQLSLDFYRVVLIESTLIQGAHLVFSQIQNVRPDDLQSFLFKKCSKGPGAPWKQYMDAPSQCTTGPSAVRGWSRRGSVHVCLGTRALPMRFGEPASVGNTLSTDTALIKNVTRDVDYKCIGDFTFPASIEKPLFASLNTVYNCCWFIWKTWQLKF